MNISNSIKSFLIIFLITSCSEVSDIDKFNSIVDEQWNKVISDNPVYASSMGDLSRNQEWGDSSLRKIFKDHEYEKEMLIELESINPKSFSEDDLTNYRLFVKQVSESVEMQQYKLYLLPFSHRGGIQLLHDTTSVLPFRSIDHYTDWIERLKKVPDLITNEIAIASQGIENNVMPPKILMERVKEQIKLQANTTAYKSPYFKHFADMDSRLFSKDEIKEIQDQALEVISRDIIPAYKNLLKFFEKKYLPNCRISIGISEIPNGKAYYEFTARRFTTTDLTPEEIHQIGLDEVKRIRDEMDDVIESVSWKGTFKAFLNDLRTNPKFYFDNPDDLFKEYLATSKRLDPELVNLFKVLPSIPYGIKPIPEESAPDTTTAYYQRPAADGSRAGYYYVNLYRPEVRPKYEIEVLSVHEAVPGHHLQIALAMELDLPNFRKYGGFTAFVEGWGLYSESLGYDMGLYKDPYSKFGQLTYDMWRAIRLVVDTGMHYMDWSRQDAINYFLDNSAKTQQDIINEVDRYINWPGQALAYKIGQLKILELKNRSKEKLGDLYDVKDFHHEVLKRGAIPLYMLEENIDAWIEDTLSL